MSNMVLSNSTCTTLLATHHSLEGLARNVCTRVCAVATEQELLQVVTVKVGAAKDEGLHGKAREGDKST
jgi:hypothetical protein